MSRRGVLDVVVVGAGVVGAAAALALARDGLTVALVEAREPAPWHAAKPDLRVYAFAPDNAALLEDLGVWRGVLERRAQPYRAMQVWDAAGGKPLRFDADQLARRELGWIVEHGLLVDRLWAALPAAGVQLHCPDRVIGLQHDHSPGTDADSTPGGRTASDDVATLQLESGLRLRARLVVAADGAESPLRALAGIGVDHRVYGQQGLVAFIETSHPHRETCWQRFLPSGPLAFLPFSNRDDDAGAAGVAKGSAASHCSSIVWTLPTAEASRLMEVDDVAFLAELERAFDGPLGEMRAVSARAAFPLRRQLARSHHAGRVVLVGDAAHVVHPLAGQGVNMGLRDVGTLRQELSAGAARGGDFAVASRLSRWSRARRSENALAAYAFEGLNRLFSTDSMAATLLRGPAMGAAGMLPPLNRALWQRAAGL